MKCVKKGACMGEEDIKLGVNSINNTEFTHSQWDLSVGFEWDRVMGDLRTRGHMCNFTEAAARSVIGNTYRQSKAK